MIHVYRVLLYLIEGQKRTIVEPARLEMGFGKILHKLLELWS